MPFTLSVPLSVTVDVHEIEGGGFWGEVRQFPGCIAQAETLDELKSRILMAIRDWWAVPGVQTEDAARELAEIQGSSEIPDGPYPLPYGYRSPSSWTKADEVE